MARHIVSRAGMLLLTIVLSPGVRGEEPRAPIRVPLVVTDGRGASITDLGPADLEITENGSSRSIASVLFHGPAARRIVIVLDEYHVSPGPHTDRARASVAAFIDRYVRPGDNLTIVRPPAHYQGGPTDVESARTAVQQFNGRKGDYTTRGAFEAEFMGSAPVYAARQRAQIVRAALESVATAMTLGDDAKALIVVTEGFEQGEPTRSRTTTLRAIGRAARVSNMPVYILDPSVTRPETSPFNDAWRSIAAQTGGMLFEAGSPMEAAFSRIASDLSARYEIKFDPSAREDGGFHSIEVHVKRKGAIVRAPTGYWAPFATSRFTRPLINRADYLRTPHSSGLIQTWLRMEPGPSGRTRVTFAWAPRPAGARATQVNLEAVSFEGDQLQAVSSVAAVGSTLPGAAAAEVSFEAPPGPIQLSMAIQGGEDALLATDVQYVDVLRFETRKPVIAAIEFLRPGSSKQFEAVQSDPLVMPIEAREFFKYDRLLLRVRAYSGQQPADVTVRLLDRSRSEVLRLPVLASIGGASQFDLPFTPYPRGEYYLDVRATSGGLETDRLLTIRLTR